jgi:uncharacterized protein
MRDFRDAKAMAQTLREALKAKSVVVTHAESLELISRILGFSDWNVLSARIQSDRPHPGEQASASGAAVSSAALTLPAVPVRDVVFFPQSTGPLFLGRMKSKRAVQQALANDGRIVAVTQKRSGDDHPAPADLYGVGVTARVIEHVVLADGSMKLLVQALKRVAITRLADGEFLAAEVAPIEDRRGHEPEAVALAKTVLDAYQAYANVDLSSPPQALLRLPHISEPGVLADTIATLLSIGIEQRQQVLEIDDVIVRLQRVLELMKTGRQAA